MHLITGWTFIGTHYLANTTKTAKDINDFKNFLVNERKINQLKFDYY